MTSKTELTLIGRVCLVTFWWLFLRIILQHGGTGEMSKLMTHGHRSGRAAERWIYWSLFRPLTDVCWM